MMHRDSSLHWPPKAGGFRLEAISRRAKRAPLSQTFGTTSIRSTTSDERLGYPTQKPLALLERIISASSNEGDVVLDPFCGCGTAVDAAQKLKRKWIGIDITHLAISLIEKRLKDRYKGRAKFEVHGTPKDLDGARDLASATSINSSGGRSRWWKRSRSRERRKARTRASMA